MKMKNFMLFSALSILTMGVLVASHSYAEVPKTKPVVSSPKDIAKATSKMKECKTMDVTCTCTGGSVSGDTTYMNVSVDSLMGEKCVDFVSIGLFLNSNANELCSDGSLGSVYSGVDYGTCTIEWDCVKRFKADAAICN